MSAATKLKACIVIPAFNEREIIGTFLGSLDGFLQSQFGTSSRYAFSIIVVNDGSRDATEQEILDFAAGRKSEVSSIELISFTRNFGHQAAIIAGMTRAAQSGADLVISMDADGEHPVQLIPQLLDHWERGALIVHTVRRPHGSVGWFKRTSGYCYYRLLKFTSGIAIGPGMADFKLWDGVILRQVVDFLPLCGSTRAFASWLYPSGPIIEYDQHFQEGRRSRFGVKEMGALAIGGLVRFSVLPLRMSLFFGLLSVSFSLLFSLFVVISYYNGRTLGGWASLTLVITITAGLQAIMIGFLGEYLLRHNFNSTLPRFVISPEQRKPAPDQRSMGP